MRLSVFLIIRVGERVETFGCPEKKRKSEQSLIFLILNASYAPVIVGKFPKIMHGKGSKAGLGSM